MHTALRPASAQRSPHGLAFTLLAILLAASSTLAHAECEIDPPSICPSEPGTPTGDDTLCEDICIDVAPGDPVTILCDLGARRDHATTPHGNAYAVAVLNHMYGTGDSLCDGTYCIWGHDVTGSNFLCEYDTFEGNLVEVFLKGGEANDKLFFWYFTGGNPGTTFKLETWDSETSFTGRMEGSGGNDELHGSNSTTAVYYDKIFGGNDKDNICTHAGNDEGHGDQDDDKIDCGDGNDLCSGGSGDDDICAKGGIDNVLGGTNDDVLVSGSPEDDDIVGGAGYNYCDESDTDCDESDATCPW